MAREYSRALRRRDGRFATLWAFDPPLWPLLMDPDNIRIVLVEPSHPGNIGAVARAMKNMGLSRLYLVAPEQFPDPQATWRAVSAADVLSPADRVLAGRGDLGDCSFVVGTSAKDKRIPWPVLDARRAVVEIGAASRQGEVALLFGREDNGLSNEELMRCNLHLAIPTSDVYSSLNLAMAVQVVSLRATHAARR
jgi:tRNA (cytidine32/uridine32-2'-O)-methyltransferase